MSPRVADVLIIGAMKCGTTTLFDDLAAQHAFSGADPKEPEQLGDDAVLSRRGRAAYASVFRGCDPDTLWVDGSTGYTKLPDIAGVPGRAAAVLPEGFKAVYLVREPVARVISHHAHMYSTGEMHGDIDACVREHPEMINWTRYAMQARAWLDVIGGDRLLILRFEDFVSDRVGSLTRICGFLGAPFDGSAVETQRISNKSDGRLSCSPLTLFLARNPLYHKIRWALPQPVRARLRLAVMAPSKPKPAAPSRETVELILDTLAEDHRDLAELMGVEGPVWDRAARLSRARAEAALAGDGAAR